MKLAGMCLRSRLSSAQAGSVVVVCWQPPGRHGLVGAALSAFFFFFWWSPFCTAIPSLCPWNWAPIPTSSTWNIMGPTGKMRKRGRHTPVGRKRSKREENAKKMWSAGEKEQKEQEGEEVIVTEESGKGRVRVEEMRRKKRTELMEEERTVEERERRRAAPPRWSISLGS